jgi:hypothetical protein
MFNGYGEHVASLYAGMDLAATTDGAAEHRPAPPADLAWSTFGGLRADGLAGLADGFGRAGPRPGQGAGAWLGRMGAAPAAGLAGGDAADAAGAEPGALPPRAWGSGFIYVVAHFAVWVWLDMGFAGARSRQIWSSGPISWSVLPGFLLLVPLAVTSTDGWLRRMGARPGGGCTGWPIPRFCWARCIS